MTLESTTESASGIGAGLRRRIAGEGGYNDVLRIAFPMIISSATFMGMMMTDRVFLSRLGPSYIAAAGSGGLMSFMSLTFFMGLIGYVNALVAQHVGAKEPERCGVATTQGMICGLCGYPLILLWLPLGLYLLGLADHAPAQQVLEKQYFTILVAGAVISLPGVAIRSFFAGIGRTTVVMVASAVAMVVNIAVNYVLIFGHFGFPRLEIAGAAYGTLAGDAAGVLVFVYLYLGKRCRAEYQTHRALKYDRVEMRRLLRFGMPSGIEFFLNLAAFNLFVQLFHSYGQTAATAMTITFNWDMVAFFPIFGFSVAATSLVGRYVGARNIPSAERAAYSGIQLAWIYSGVMGALFLICPGALVSIFVQRGAAGDYSAVVPMATAMLRLAALYTLSDATALVFGGALRGAGDTHWCMRMSIALHWLMAAIGFVLIKLVRADEMLVWGIFVLLVVFMGCVYYLRFRHGAWKNIDIFADRGNDSPVGRADGGNPETLSSPIEVADMHYVPPTEE